MSSPPTPPQAPPPRPGGAHRGEPAPRSLVLPVVGVIAVIAALALAGYMLVTSNSQDTDDVGGNASTSPTVNLSPSQSPGASSQSPSESNGSDTSSGQPTDTGSGKPTKKPSDKPSDKPTKNSSSKPIPQISVYVFNQTTITGLAAQVGGQLSSVGWNVVGIDNWRGTVPEDTVYYYPGDKAAAEQLSRQFPEIGRVWPASSPMPAGALTVILATTSRK